MANTKRDVATDGLSDRDRDILRMIGEFGGKTFIEVLERTYWHGRAVPTQQARDRVQKLKKKYKLLRSVPTGLMKPRNAIALTDFGKRWVKDETDIDTGTLFLSPVTAWHNIYEQIAWYWLRMAGREVSRTIVKRWSADHKHTPDLLYFHNGDEKKPVYVEIELNPKNNDRMLKIFKNMDADRIHAVLYVYENEKRMKQYGRKLPINDKVYLTNIDDLIRNVEGTGKVGAIPQIDFIKKYEGEWK